MQEIRPYHSTSVFVLPAASRALAIVLLVLLGGCAAGPDYERPAPPNAAGYFPQALSASTVASDVPDGASQHFDANRDIPFDWWTLFHSPQLNALIERAFKSNPGVDSAQAALRKAKAYVDAQQGYFYPTVGLAYSATRNKLAGNNGGGSPGVQGNGQVIQTYSNPAGPAPYNAPVYYDFHTAQLTVSYVPDVFGASRRQVESLQAEMNAQRYQLEAAYLTLASNMVAAALQEASLRAQITAMDKIVAASRENLAIVQKQLKLGYVSALDVAAQQAALAQFEQALIPLHRQLELTRDLIRTLAGNTPDKDVPETFELASLHLPEDLPVSLPSRLIEQRPDIRVAEEQLHASSARYGVTIANTLPQFQVSGEIGGMAASPGWMFRSGGGFFDLAINAAYTIFDGGTLRALSRAAQQELAQAADEYRYTVMVALQNVADTLHAIQSDAEALQAAANAEHALALTRDLTRKQYDAGYVSYQALLLAEQNYRQSLITLIQAQTNRLGDTAALYQALGGGWWNRPESVTAARGENLP